MTGGHHLVSGNSGLSYLVGLVSEAESGEKDRFIYDDKHEVGVGGINKCRVRWRLCFGNVREY